VRRAEQGANEFIKGRESRIKVFGGVREEKKQQRKGKNMEKEKKNILGGESTKKGR